MKIYNLELESVRNIRHLRLDLSAPCTVITGRTGTCKSTVQLATLVSLFRTSKKERDSLISRFDPDVKPKAILELSRNENGPTIKLSRSLLDDGGEWREGGSTTRAKGKALDKVQEVLPISANAAACLLWGQQECLCDVLKEFPADGHSALTAATVRGAGPDPKRVIDELDKSYKASKRAGNSPGAWTRMSERVSQLEAELTASQQAEQELNQLREQYAASSSVHRQLSGERLSCKSTLQQLREQQKCLKAVLGVNKDLASARKSQAEWNQLDSRAAKQTATCTTLEDELNVLQSQYRVARDKELASEIAQLDSHVKLVTMARTKVLGAEVQISAKSRPDRKSLDRLRELSTELRDANTRMEANGLRYRVTVEHGQFNVEIAEDTESAITKVVTRESPHESIVGSVVIKADALRFAAGGKEDVASLKRTAERVEKERQQLLNQFLALDELNFETMANERSHLESELRDRKTELVESLKGKTFDKLQLELQQRQDFRRTNGMTGDDQAFVGERFLPGSAEIEKRMLRKETELDSARSNLAEIEQARPTEAEQHNLKSQITVLESKHALAMADFRGRDENGHEPSDSLMTELEEQLATNQSTFESVDERFRDAEKDLARLVAELKHAGPERLSSAVESDLDEARAQLRREETLQDARRILSSRIELKMQEMAADVPIELGARISQHMRELSAGAFGSVKLDENLSMCSVQQANENRISWKMDELSAGERTLVALTLRIAVALSFAELAGHIFVMLDDSLVNLDPEYREATERLLCDLVSDGRLQVVLFTCHEDWARSWEKRATEDVRFVNLPSVCEYFQTPAALMIPEESKDDDTTRAIA